MKRRHECELCEERGKVIRVCVHELGILIQFVFGSVWLCLDWVGLLVLSPFSVATCRERWFCLHGCLCEVTNAQICARANVLAQITMVWAPIYMNKTKVLLKVDTHLCDK